jgi:cell division protein FtsB
MLPKKKLVMVLQVSLLAFLFLIILLVVRMSDLAEAESDNKKLNEGIQKLEERLDKLENKSKKLEKSNIDLKKENKKLKKKLLDASNKPPVIKYLRINPKPNIKKSYVVQMIQKSFGEYGNSAVLIGGCESSDFSSDVVYGPRVGGAGERGIFQIHPVHIADLANNGFTWDDMFIPEKNIAYAKIVFTRAGSRFSSDWVNCSGRYGIA